MPKFIKFLPLQCIAAVIAIAAVTSGGYAENAHPTRADALAKHFVSGGLVTQPKIVDCRLSGGTQTKCISLTTRPEPTGFSMGPWCPRFITDGPDKAGIWLHDGDVHDADGSFIKNASTFFKDKKWQLFDPETGRVRVTDNEKACRAAARPDVDAKYQNYCVECETSYVKSDMTQTFVIPLTPIRAPNPSQRISRNGAGLSFNGIRLDAPAPVHAILGAHTLAPFDDCGGHVNPHVGYHIHAVTDCLKSVTIKPGHAPAVGLALDGHTIYARTFKSERETSETAPSKQAPPSNALADLDRCGGHSDPHLGYHYHVGKPGSNAILGCHVAERGCVLDSPDKSCDATSWWAWLKSWIN